MENATSFSRIGRRRGFMLMEAMVAIAIFAIAVVGLARTLNSTAKFATEARLAGEVTRKMESLLEEAMHMPVMEPGQWPLEADESGLAFLTVIGEAEVVNQDGTLLDGVFKIEITAERRRSGRAPDVWKINTLAYPPLYGSTR